LSRESIKFFTFIFAVISFAGALYSENFHKKRILASPARGNSPRALPSPRFCHAEIYHLARVKISFVGAVSYGMAATCGGSAPGFSVLS